MGADGQILTGPDGKKKKIGAHCSTLHEGKAAFGKHKLGYQTTHGRGTYTTPDFWKALAFATPHGEEGIDVFLRLVPLLRIPGNEQDIGITMGKLTGKFYVNKGKALGYAEEDWVPHPDAWPLFSARDHVKDFCEEKNWSKEEVQEVGFFKKCVKLI